MQLEELNISEKKINQMKKKNINTVEDLIYTFPRKYIDFRTPKTPETAQNGEKCVMICTIMEIRKKDKYVEVVGREVHTFGRVYIKWFGQPHKFYEVENLYNIDVAVGGVYKKDEWGSQYVNPEVFTTDLNRGLSLTPIYSKITGMSNDFFLMTLNQALKIFVPDDCLSNEFKDRFGLISEKEMIHNYHSPANIDDIKKANKKMAYNRLYKMAKNMVRDSQTMERKSSYYPRKLTNTNKLIQSLPYELTDDQKTIVKEFVEQGQHGKRINALIQGDVGYGKTVCVFLIMFAMADNGYQSVLMAPTGLLARQHFNELNSYSEKFGYKTVFLSGELKAKERREILEKIKNGEATFIVGTHSVISDSVEFKNLGLTVVDEEHKFGVIQRETLRKKASEGVHSISMSATPIPRSLALTLYGDAMDIYTIKSRPKGRLPIKTGVVNDDKAIFSFMQHEIEQGHQCYIVCPLIENDDIGEYKETPESVEEVYEKVCNYFKIHNPSIKAAIITGKMKDSEKVEINEAFSKNEVQILIATTIIEVGVNVPNATVITIMNAERFGLAGLHQLRGRVGRSNLQSYCMLKSNELQNERLRVMCQTTDGFEIAQEDLKLRGTGDFFGTRQSGDNEDVKLMLRYPDIYQNIKQYITENEVNVNESLEL